MFIFVRFLTRGWKHVKGPEHVTSLKNVHGACCARSFPRFPCFVLAALTMRLTDSVDQPSAKNILAAPTLVMEYVCGNKINFARNTNLRICSTELPASAAQINVSKKQSMFPKSIPKFVTLVVQPFSNLPQTKRSLTRHCCHEDARLRPIRLPSWPKSNWPKSKLAEVEINWPKSNRWCLLCFFFLSFFFFFCFVFLLFFTFFRWTTLRRTTLRRTTLRRTTLRRTTLRRTAQNFALFFPSFCHNFHSSFSLLGSFLGILLVFLKAGTLKCAHLGSDPRTPNVHISGPRRFKNPTKNSTKGPPRERRKKENCGGGGKKSAKFWAPHPSGPHPSVPHPLGPTLRGPTFLGLGPPPFGARPEASPHPSGPHPFQGSTLLGSTLRGPFFLGLPPPFGAHPSRAPHFVVKFNIRIGRSRNWPKSKKRAGRSRNWPKSITPCCHTSVKSEQTRHKKPPDVDMESRRSLANEVSGNSPSLQCSLLFPT